jgi:hypothetical protein
MEGYQIITIDTKKIKRAEGTTVSFWDTRTFNLMTTG